MAADIDSRTNGCIAEDGDSSLTGSGMETDDDIDSTQYEVDTVNRSKRMRVAGCILLMELCERLTFYSISANLVLFCSSVLHLDDNVASSVSLAFTGE